MAYRVLSESSFAAVIRAGDSQRFKVNLKSEREEVMRSAIEFANTTPAKLPAHNVATVRGKRCVSYSEYETHLVLRSIGRHLQRRLRIALPNRDRAVRGVIEALLDSTPMHIVRRDISSFYETIPLSRMKDHLLYDTASSAQVRAFLRTYFDQHCASKTCGLPRGIGLSAILAEYALQDFDQEARRINGVYRYFRFADDIILFSMLPPKQVSLALNDLLPAPMKFNSKKSLDVSLDVANAAGETTFDYLGYRFSVTKACGIKSSRKVTVTISEKKLNRLKSRIFLSLKDFVSHGNYDLLKQRIRFLASNYSLRRNGISKTRGATHIKSGIYYNYHLCGEYEFKSHRHHFTESPAIELKSLDWFFNNLIRNKASIFSSRLSNFQREELARYSFCQGYRKKMTARFRAEEVHAIKAVWSRHG